MAAAKYRDVRIADESRTLRVIDIIYAFRAAEPNLVLLLYPLIILLVGRVGVF